MLQDKLIRNALSIDLEDWYQGMLQVNYGDWNKYEDRLSASVDKILNLLSSQGRKATFFTLGYIAERHPEIIRQVAQAGHEIASHGYAHRPVYAQTPEEFRDDVIRSKKIIEAISATEIIGYRAPFFSITKKSLWALGILQELGFKYDSSIFPTRNFLYGIPDAPQTIYRPDTEGLIEFPLSVLRIRGLNLPVCGGFYLRTLPYFISAYGIRQLNRRGWPAIIYLHPWELDTDKPKIPYGLKWRIIYDHNIAKTENKFRCLLKNFEFTTIREVLFGAKEKN